ncbi:MAG: phosphatidate cytidylyltransferase, partial [Proteobacteria bacterium]|nr:phosphatidate cytidylyltransferase [Pseudomonadota bacterium]
MSSSPFASLPVRILVALIAIPVILWIIFQGGYWFMAFVALLSSLALYEFYGLTEAKGAFPLKSLGIVAGFLINASFVYERAHLQIFDALASQGMELSMFSQLQFQLVVLIVFLAIVLLSELFRKRGSPLLNAGATVSGVLFIALFFGTLIAIRELFPYGFPLHKFRSFLPEDGSERLLIDHWGGMTVAAIIVALWVCDTAAYFFGLAFGRHRLFERVSPKKSWEGAIAGFFGAVLTILAAQQLVLPYVSLVQAAVL